MNKADRNLIDQAIAKHGDDFWAREEGIIEDLIYCLGKEGFRIELTKTERIDEFECPDCGSGAKEDHDNQGFGCADCGWDSVDGSHSESL